MGTGTVSLEMYYHATMQKYEQQLLRKHKAISKIRTVSREEKKSILAYSGERLRKWFIFEKVKELPHPTTLPNHDAFIEYVSRFPLQECFSFPVVMEDSFPCPLLDGHIGWFHEDTNGHIRYYTKNKKELSIALDLIDFIELSESVGSLEAFRLAQKQTGIAIVESGSLHKQRKLYEKNIKTYRKRLSEDVNQFSRFLKPLTVVYEELQTIASMRVEESDVLVGRKHIFFASTRYIAERIGDISNVTVNRVLNALDAIGLIEKVSYAQIPEPLRVKSEAWADALGYKNIIGYFLLPSFEEIEEEARVRVKKIKDMGWSYRNFSKPRKEELFGTLVIETSIEEKCIKDRFSRNLLLRGYVTKELVMQDAPCTKTRAKKIVDEKWNIWLNEHGCIYRKPSKEMKEKMKLKTYQYIAIKESLVKPEDVQSEIRDTTIYQPKKEESPRKLETDKLLSVLQTKKLKMRIMFDGQKNISEGKSEKKIEYLTRISCTIQQTHKKGGSTDPIQAGKQGEDKKIDEEEQG